MGNCFFGLEAMVVLSPRHMYTGISLAPSSVEFDGPTVAPTSSTTRCRAVWW